MFPPAGDGMWLKYVHVGCAILSVSGYFLRGVWMLRDSPMLRRLWVRVAPHVIDTLLLLSALLLAVRIGQYPFVHGWLTAKVLGVVAYIVLGSIGLKRGRTMGVRIAAWLAALIVFAYIVGVALTRSASLGLL